MIDFSLAEIAVLSASMRDPSGRSSAIALEHLTEMTKQSETSDIGTGMDLGPIGLQLIDQAVLALAHHRERRVQMGRRAGRGHGCSEQHSVAERATQQQCVAHLNTSLGPWVAAAAVHTQADLQSQAHRCRCSTARLQCVATDQLCPLFLQHRLDPIQGLEQKSL